MAANEDESIPQPRLGLGHIDPRYNDEKVYDGGPAFGKATNLRLSENGMTIYADYVGVPKWLAPILPFAFPSRSIEGYWDVESAHGKTWPFVLTACKLLGVNWPGITVLEDLPQYYGEEVPADVVIAPELALAVAASNQPGGDPMKLFKRAAASASVDKVRNTFYKKYVLANSAAQKWWIQAVLSDPNELVVLDDVTGMLHKLPFSSDDKGEVAFGDADPVVLDYVPADRESQLTAASHVAATLAIGREVLASWPSRAESSPETTGGAMDPKEIRKHLNLPEDASDEQVQTALLQRAGITAAEPATPAAEPTPTTPVAPTLVLVPPTAAEPAAPVAPVAAQPAPEAMPVAATAGAQVVQVDKNTWDATLASLGSVNSFMDAQLKRDREGLVAAAITDGRIPPASKDGWLQLLESDPNGEKTLASLAKGIVPVTERGHGHAPDELGTQQVEAEIVAATSASWFPEVARHRAEEAQVAASGGVAPRSRISTDANYRR
jgi:hypothetical protein